MQRHNLVYIRDSQALTILDRSLPQAVVFKIKQWVENGFPLTMTRQECCENRDTYLVATTVFVQQRKYRVLCQVPHHNIKQITPALNLIDMVSSFSHYQQQQLMQWIQQLEQYQCIARVYGSFAYQYLYQEPYTTAQSDLDILLHVEKTQYLPEIMECVRQFKTQFSLSLDGEVMIDAIGQLKYVQFSFNEYLRLSENALTEDMILIKYIDGMKLYNWIQFQKDILNETNGIYITTNKSSTN